MLDTETLTVQASVGELTCIMLRAVVEGKSKGNVCLVLIEQGDTIHASREDDESTFICHS